MPDLNCNKGCLAATQLHEGRFYNRYCGYIHVWHHILIHSLVKDRTVCTHNNNTINGWPWKKRAKHKYSTFAYLLATLYCMCRYILYTHAYTFSMASVVLNSETNYPYKHKQKLFLEKTSPRQTQLSGHFGLGHPKVEKNLKGVTFVLKLLAQPGISLTHVISPWSCNNFSLGIPKFTILN